MLCPRLEDWGSLIVILTDAFELNTHQSIRIVQKLAVTLLRVLTEQVLEQSYACQLNMLRT